MSKTWCTITRNSRHMHNQRVIIATYPVLIPHRHLFWTGNIINTNYIIKKRDWENEENVSLKSWAWSSEKGKMIKIPPQSADNFQIPNNNKVDFTLYDNICIQFGSSAGCLLSISYFWAVHQTKNSDNCELLSWVLSICQFTDQFSVCVCVCL